MISVTLNSEDISQAALYAGMRNRKRQGTSYVGSDFMAHFYGMLAEIAFFELTGLQWDRSFNMGDEGLDFQAGKFTIDVKAAIWEPPILKIRPDRVQSDIYVLSYINPKNLTKVIFYGFTLKNKVLRAPLKDWGHGDRYTLEHTQLYEMERLVRAISSRIPHNGVGE